jgi:hypothetical protein
MQLWQRPVVGATIWLASKRPPIPSATSIKDPQPSRVLSPPSPSRPSDGLRLGGLAGRDRAVGKRARGVRTPGDVLVDRRTRGYGGGRPRRSPALAVTVRLLLDGPRWRRPRQHTNALGSLPARERVPDPMRLTTPDRRRAGFWSCHAQARQHSCQDESSSGCVGARCWLLAAGGSNPSRGGIISLGHGELSIVPTTSGARCERNALQSNIHDAKSPMGSSLTSASLRAREQS